MDEILRKLEQNRKTVEDIGDRIENRETYMENLREYLTTLNEIIKIVLGLQQNMQIALEVNQEFVLQVLTDIIYGMEQEDSVFLLDVLRYGLLKIFDDIIRTLQGEV